MKALPALALLCLCTGADAHPGADADAGADTWKPPTRCELPLAQRLYESAMAAPDAAGRDGTLYGVQRWRGTTGKRELGLRFPGLLSCAYTVSAIFRGACQPIGELASVSAVEARLAKWRKVGNAAELQRGDVVFWRPVPGHVLGFKCPGHWHVGIALGGDLTMDNDWWTGQPRVGRLARPCTAFDHARRPPGQAPG